MTSDKKKTKRKKRKKKGKKKRMQKKKKRINYDHHGKLSKMGVTETTINESLNKKRLLVVNWPAFNTERARAYALFAFTTVEIIGCDYGRRRVPGAFYFREIDIVGIIVENLGAFVDP